MKKRIIALTILIITVFSFTAFASSNRINGNDYVTAYKGVNMPIPALMYHKITEDPSEVSDWTITGEMLE